MAGLDMRQMRRLVFVSVAVGLLASPAAAQPTPSEGARYPAAREVQIRDLAGFVVVTPENRVDVSLSILNPGPLNAPEVRVSGRRLIIDGKLRGQIRGCDGDENAEFSVRTRRAGRLAARQLPTIRLRVPQDAVIAANGAFRLRMGPAQSARLNFGGCGAAEIERVEDEAEVAIGGSISLRLHDVGELSLAAAGAGDAEVGAVREGLTVSVAGASDIEISRADGPTNIAVQGSGDVAIDGGRASSLSIAVAGSGDVNHDGTARSLDAVIVGSGDVHVRAVEGAINRRVIGSGEVRIGG